jgi:hypothetical protein
MESVERFIEEAVRNNVMKYHWYDPYEDNEGYNGSELIKDLKKYFNNK